MITLANLAALHATYAADLALPIAPVDLSSGVNVADGSVQIMSCINLSRDSTYRESIATSLAAARRMGQIQVAQGATLIDVGAEASHANAVRVSPDEQAATLVPVVEALVEDVGDRAVISVETYAPEVVEACLGAGARLLNMTGREHEDAMLSLAAAHDAGVVLCYGELANVRQLESLPLDDDPLPGLVDHFAPRLEHARQLGVERLVIDPGMGFAYANLTDGLARARHQTRVLAQCFRLRSLGVPVCTVLPHTLDLFGDEFRKAEGFYAVLAALGGAHLLRIHEVAHVRVVLEALEQLALS